MNECRQARVRSRAGQHSCVYNRLQHAYVDTLHDQSVQLPAFKDATRKWQGSALRTKRTFQSPSLRWCRLSTPMPLLMFLMSTVDIFVTPTAMAVSFPAAKMATGVFTSHCVGTGQVTTRS